MRRTIAAVLLLAGITPLVAGASDPKHPRRPPPARTLGGTCDGLFAPREDAGLIFSITQLAATCSLQPYPAGRVTFERNISLTGTVTDPMGLVPFRIASFTLDEILDAAGADLARRARVDTYPVNTRQSVNFRAQESPGSSRTEGFSANLHLNEPIPARLARVSGTLIVEIPDETVLIDLDPAGSQEFSRITPAFAVRLRRYPSEASTFVAQIEYRIDLDGLAAGEAAPLILGAEVRDEENLLILDQSYGNEHAATNTILGAIPLHASLQKHHLGTIRLRAATRVRQVRFDFQASDLSLAGG